MPVSLASYVQAALIAASSDAASVQVLDRNAGGLRLAGWRGFHPASAEFWDLVVPESASTCGMALVTGERVVVADLEAEVALAGTEDLNEYRRSRLRAVQSTPLVANDGQVVGMLSTHWRMPYEPSTSDLHRIEGLARRCAEAIAAERSLPAAGASMPTHLLQEVNRHIRRLAGSFTSTRADEFTQDYICECGCAAHVALISSEYDLRVASGRPVTVVGHPVQDAPPAL
jgi:GAF domain-containing protein